VTPVLALMVEAVLMTMVAMMIRRRRMFISRYPELKRFYDLSFLGFLMAALAKLVFLFLDFRDHGIFLLPERWVPAVSYAGNLLFLLTVLLLLLGWFNLLKVLGTGYRLIPVVEFREEYEHLKPGLYLCRVPECYSMIPRLLRGRAGLIISRQHPEEIRKALRIEKTPVLWISKAREENTVFPTRLEFLLQTIVDFMRSTDSPKMILLDGVEYLILENGFVPIFKFLTALKDHAIIHNTVVIVPVEDESFEERMLHLMHREFERLD